MIIIEYIINNNPIFCNELNYYNSIAFENNITINKINFNKESINTNYNKINIIEDILHNDRLIFKEKLRKKN